MKLRDFLPPVVFQVRDALKKNRSKTYASYEEAVFACAGNGYEEDELVEAIFRKTFDFKNQLNNQFGFSLSQPMAEFLVALLVSAQALDRQSINVLDLGGACGTHYFVANSILKNRIKSINWSVVETSAMAKMASALEADGLRFYEDLAKACNVLGEIDLFHSSGTLQYMADPLSTLKSILECNPTFLLLNRLTLSTGDQTIIAIQELMLSANGPGPLPAGVQDKTCYYPVTYLQRDVVERVILQKYRIVFRFVESTIGFVHGQPIVSLGYFAERL